ncbi:MAG: phosphoenolpyruvate synthase [Methylomonas sp.]|nr:MAG: phosphoenolpyruvate synthase [Methylomonas sp.]
MALNFSTKAGTLRSLQGVLNTGRIAPLVAFTASAWRAEQSDCLELIRNRFGPVPLIVRSSSLAEDGATASNAGAFLSLANIEFDNLADAIEQVITSYGAWQPDNEVLIQPMLVNVMRAGVAFSHDPNTLSPYRTINWSDGSDTAAVTSGQGGRTWQCAARAPVPSDPFFAALVALLEELLILFANVPVDCEFAVTREPEGEVLWLTQARPLVLSAQPEPDESQAQRLACIERKLAGCMRPHPFLQGGRTVYGVMPDWNPAEIIGIRPKPLALSLYRELVTDSIWAYQRHNYGYRNLRSFPLMPHFFGLPYIDVRVSFNSFIPADLDDGLAGRLVDYYIDRLLLKPALHDKVEFEIVFSCYTLDLPQRLEQLTQAGFSGQECKSIAQSLRRLTNRIVHPTEGFWRSDAGRLDTLKDRRDALLAFKGEPLEQIYWFLEDTKRYGTLPFAGLARAGFIAVQLLKSLVTVGVFSEADYDRFLNSVSTVSKTMARDRAVLDQAEFLRRYGHLRPGTYDILSPRYDKAPELYSDWRHTPNALKPDKAFSPTLPQMRRIAKLLEAHGLDIGAAGLLDFIRAGIELREFAKFHFTRNLSDILERMAALGEALGISREALAYSDISVFKELYVAAADPKQELLHSIARGKARYAETLHISLPSLITKPDDIWAFEWPETQPNFITHKQVTAPVAGCGRLECLSGSIICIPNADPGYDWLFAYPIAGLITAWGGVNSHMAIRAGELGLPAVIGAGEVLYRRWSTARRLFLDCAGRRIEVLV